MFGYVLPLRDELKVREMRQFQAAYCGLCGALSRHYGFAARFILNYDFTFLAMLLSCREAEPSYGVCRCPAHPFRKRRCCKETAAFADAAGYSVILAWWKLQDAIRDNGFFRTLPARLGAFFLGAAYHRAAAAYPKYAEACKAQLDRLQALEAADGDGLDLTADTFACILKAAAENGQGEDKRILEQLLYHVGRWIYILDACDDLEADFKTAAYNPLKGRFGLVEGVLSPEDKTWLQTTLAHSANLAASAYALLPARAWDGILQNILYLGLPGATRLVLEGKWRRAKRCPGEPEMHTSFNS